MDSKDAAAAWLVLAALLPWPAGAAEDQVELLERAIEHELDINEGGALTPPRGSADLFQPGREIRIIGRRLDTLKTWAPQNDAIPLLERQLDRAERPLTGRPQPVLRDPLPPSGRALGFGRR